MKAEGKLAINGGEPVRKTRLNYARQWIDWADIDAVTEALNSDFLTCGPRVPLFEKKLCRATGADYAVAVSNGTAALHIACLAAGIGPGDEVIVSPITFAASANCVLYCGGTPVFADIDKDTWNLSPACAERAVTSRTRAVIAVDYMGQAASLYELERLCRKHGLVLIEDASHSLGTRYDGREVGDIADLTTFSFHPVKIVTTGEGGAVTTNSQALYEKAALLRAHGITREKEKFRDADAGDWYYEQQALGYNYRMSDLQAALGLSQLDKLPLFSRRRKDFTAFYDGVFGQMEEILLPREIPQSDTVRHLYVIRLNRKFLRCGRKTVFDALQAENIGVNVHYIPVYRLPYYEKMGYPRGLCPNAEDLYETCLTLPLYPAMTEKDAQDVIAAVKKVLSYFRKG